MNILREVDLKPYNTFGISATAEKFVTADSIDAIREILSNPHLTNELSFILGGGSNVLLTKDVAGLTLQIGIKGMELVHETDEHYFVRVGGGVVWHEFVMHCVNEQWAGIENLSLIPGNVGASPMQNIGAYGVEVKNLIEEVQAVECGTGNVVTFKASECEFGYRTSIFKTSAKDQFIITHVVYRLNKHPQFNTSYGAIEQELERLGITELSVKAISNAVINIRQSKLPDPKVLGNAGSFFKNPVVEKETWEQIHELHPNAPGYIQPDGRVKLAAGWLIEQCGWKGKKIGHTGCHVNQALVLVNYGGATGSEVYALSDQIIESVNQKFGVTLEREVNIL